MAYSLCVTDRSSSTNRTSVVHLFTGMPASFDVERRVRKLLQSCGKSTEKFFGDKHDLDVHHKTHSSQSYLYCAFIANEATTSIITMEDDDHNGCVNEDLIVGGIDDLDNSMMESLFNLSAYVSGTINNDNDDDESDDDDYFSQHGGRNNCQDAASHQWIYLTGSNRPAEVFISINDVDNRLLGS